MLECMSENLPATQTNRDNGDISDFLNELLTQNPNSIKSEIAKEALDYHCPAAFFEDLLQHGCVSGMVGKMIYYDDTHAFFDKHYHVIEEIRHAVEENLGEKLSLNGDLKNSLAWFAFEETAYQLALETGVVN